MTEASFIPAPGAEPLPGYRLVKRLGRGGYGEVWKATAPGDIAVALKFVPLEKAAGAVELRALDLVRHVRHPNLLAMHGAWQKQGNLIIAMELADRTLAQRCNEASAGGLPGIPRDELLGYFLEAARAIDYLNEPHIGADGQERAAIQHRDIKPQNILLVGGGVKVADFGLARVMRHTVTGHSQEGLTLAYAAPEFFDGRTTKTSDQYSLAITWCVMRGGRLPFEGSYAQLIAGHLHSPPDLSMIPAEEQPLVARALAKDANGRWPTCRAFVEALAACSSAHRAPPAPPVPPSPPLPPPLALAYPEPEIVEPNPPSVLPVLPLVLPYAETLRPPQTPPATPAVKAGEEVVLAPPPKKASAAPAGRRQWVVGRAADCDLVANHPAVSGQHCRLIETPEGFRLEDLHSSNGTYVNGQRIQGTVSIRRSDRVTLGQAVPMPWPAEGMKEEGRGPKEDAPPAPLPPPPAAPPNATVLRVGRGPDNEIVLDYPAVSAHHARITLDGGKAWIEDLGSTNGTAIGRPEHKITRAPLSAEDVVFFGSLHVPAARLLHGRLTLGEKPCAVVAFRGRPIVFGRDPGCDQILSYPMISGRHARLWRDGAELMLEDLGSSNGTFLNGQRIRKPVPVKPGDVIGLGSYSFKLNDSGHLEQRDFRGNVTLAARGVTVAIPGRRLLEDVSLTIFPGELVGLMGPSGAGKTTLMSALNGYTPPAEGEVLLNGHSLYEHYPQYAPFLGYVPQDDIIHRSLTVGQALYYTARLRLPSDYRAADIQARVRHVLHELGLEGVEDVLVGSPEKRGISGGQRKRVNLAMELLTDPLVLYLDEPTSGLSSEDALLVVRLLRRLADAGRTILLTIHQPGPEVFRLLDNVAVVARDAGPPQPGRLVYYGPAYPDAVRFFNPGVAAKGATDLNPDEVLRGLGKQPTDAWVSRYRASSYHREYVEDRAGKRPAGAATTRAIQPRPASRWSQWWVLVCRCAAIKAKDVWNTAVLLGQAPLIAILIVMVYGRQLRQEAVADKWLDVSSALGQALFLIVLSALWFGCTNAVREIVGEWAVYRRERMVGLKLFPYMASKFSALGALCLVQCAVLLGVVHWGCGLKASWPASLLLLLLASLVGVAVGLTISAVARTSEFAIALLPLVLLPMIIFGGVLHPIDQMDRIPQLACQVMPSRWAFEGLVVMEARNREKALHLPGEPDMAERSFPREGRRLGPWVSGVVLCVFLGVLIGLIRLILRARDGEVYRGRLLPFFGRAPGAR